MIEEKIFKINITNVLSLQYSYDLGAFFNYDDVNNKVDNAFKCRDEFGMWFGSYYCENERESKSPIGDETLDYRYKYIGFSKVDINYEQIVKFLTKIENKLKLKQKSKYYKCVGEKKNPYNGKITEIKDKYILIELSPFWIETQNFVKISLYTLLLRSAACYYNDDIQVSLNQYSLSSKVILAINHFLKGNTQATFKKWQNKYTDFNGSAYYGFVGQFQDKSQEELNALLVRPNKPTKEMAKIDQKEQESPKELLTS